MSDPGRVLVVEDEQALRDLLERRLGRSGFAVRAVPSAEEALELPDEFDVAVCDLALPGMSGLDLIRRLGQRSPTTQSIVITGHGSVPSAIEAMKLGAYHYFEKPVKFKELELYVRGACEKRRLSRENASYREAAARGASQTEAFVGDSEAARHVRQLIERVARAPTPVLIEGETGTGKDLVARAIHGGSPRADKPFVAVDCGALSESLLENELFGHVTGAFTGASNQQSGLFEVADEGTLFIDEVGEMSLEIQKKFLRVLETGEFRRLGDSRTRRASVRVVAATNRVLKDLVAEGRFREDLYYRLNVLAIRTPPLREHPEDIPTIVEELLERARSSHGRRIEVAPEAVESFQRYRWPGNVRELRNVLERAAVLAPGDTVRLEDCPGLDDDDAAPAPAAPETADPRPPSASDRLEDVEREHIRRVLEDCGGNKTHAAERLGVSLRSLYRRLEKLELK